MRFATILCLATSATAAFTSLAIRPGSALNLKPLQARGNSIYIGGLPESYCPKKTVSNCPTGNVTSFAISGTGAGSMNVAVEGGQKLYVGPAGALHYTLANSSTVPNGSFNLGFARHPAPAKGGISTWNFTMSAADGFLACPVKVKKLTEYKVYANMTGGVYKNCISFVAGAATYKGYGAYLYL